jgi:signal peptidase
MELTKKSRIQAIISFIMVFFLASVGIVMLPLLFGFQSHSVLSNSMSPLVTKGDIVLTAPVSSNQIQLGDIIMYESTGRAHSNLLHRVQEIHHENSTIQFVVKGDRNEYADFEPVLANQVKGIYKYRFPYMGWVINFIKTNQLYIIIFLVIGFFFTNFSPLPRKVEERHGT